MNTPLQMLDMYCGGGGASQGGARAFRKAGRRFELAAINHWAPSVATHRANHKDARHFQMRVENVDPKDVVRGDLHLLWASPSCTSFSKARGQAPVEEQMRSGGFEILQWIERTRPIEVCVENVEEFREWGPLDSAGHPIQERKGESFRLWLRMFEHLGYRLEHKLLRCADFGDPTTRRRLFIRGSRNGAPRWPEPSHGAGRPRAWKTLRDSVMYWSNTGALLREKKRRLVFGTHRRMAIGLNRYGGEPFILAHRHGGKSGECVDSVDAPGRTLTASNATDNYLVVPRRLGTARWELRHRPLTLSELARIQGFPEGYRFCGRTKRIKARQVGNSVPARTAEQIIRAMIDSL